ncbi:hypothetical protein [Acidovorax sp. SUPP3334]|uniref:hypothetical protein n=1 Tax=Acidovorax sp. SUPP3334 TaxID=2920881 RepID=UPI0023DE4174|nr:hypothetical protein [Acidovorax sp. SUPP3334]GKT21145.1 hypothetical protein AVHM3334_03765 [Acidovorax sp. SUPP3334]
MTRKSWPFLSTYQERSSEQRLATPAADSTRLSAQSIPISLGTEGVSGSPSAMGSGHRNHCSDFASSTLLPSAA